MSANQETPRAGARDAVTDDLIKRLNFEATALIVTKGRTPESSDVCLLREAARALTGKADGVQAAYALNAALLPYGDPIDQMRRVLQVAREHDSLISRKWVEGWADQWEKERATQPAATGAGEGLK